MVFHVFFFMSDLSPMQLCNQTTIPTLYSLNLRFPYTTRFLHPNQEKLETKLCKCLPKTHMSVSEKENENN